MINKLNKFGINKLNNFDINFTYINLKQCFEIFFT